MRKGRRIRVCSSEFSLPSGTSADGDKSRIRSAENASRADGHTNHDEHLALSCSARRTKPPALLVLGLVCVVLSAGVSVDAAVISWTDNNGNWSVGNNWSGGTPPGNNDDAVNDKSGTLITHNMGNDVTKSLALKASALLISGGTLQVTNGVTLDGGVLNVGGGALSKTKVQGSGMVVLTDSANSVLNGVSFDNVDIVHKAGGTVTVKNGLTLSTNESLAFSGGSKIVFDGAQQLSNGQFQVSGTPTITLSPGTALTIKSTFFRVLNLQDSPPVNLTIGNKANPATTLNLDGFIRIGPTQGLSDVPATITLSANKVVNSGLLFLSIGTPVTTYNVSSDEFTNVKGATVSMNGGSDNFRVGKFTNDGEFSTNTELAINTSSFTNNGTFEVLKDVKRVRVDALDGVGAVAVNNGKVAVAQGADLSFLTGYTQKAGSTTVDGNLNVLQGGNKTTGRLEGGTVGGNGTINGNLQVVKGIVKPGDSPGVLTINGDYAQEAGGTLDIEIDGPTFDPSMGIAEYSRLVVNGSTFLSGLLDVVIGAGFIPRFEDTFTILTSAHGLEGFFENALPPPGSNIGNLFVDRGFFEVIYNESSAGVGSVMLTRFSVSEPSMSGLLGVIGLALIAARHIRRRHV